MMTNLFSIFDPTTIIFSMNWLSMLIYLMFLPNLYWFIPSQYIMIWMKLLMFLIKEMKISLSKNINNFNMLFFNILFIFILLNNFISLFPYIFSNTSHLCMTLPFSLILWITFMFFGWIKNYNHMFIHLTPQGTPYILMPFMVLIESVSNLIRPLTLAVRLSANIIAGHLLMTLISQTSNNLSKFMIIMMIMIQSMLIILEVAVSFIQSYVFSILSSLYSSETN
uniref:ATP synthase subunit a n=1 Tax=Paramblynotus sp. ZJUH 20220012 TaxID=2943458 RepID=A0A9E8G7B6_9HYME|nr:ATP synthase F0 subunit 6 [Paramblynotus sp. ZJUH 20220012]